jgi:hypothetical protein
MSSYVTCLNATDGPLHIDRAGRVLGSGEFGAVRGDTWPGKGLIDDGHLLVVERPEGAVDADLDPGALAAFQATDAANAGDAPPAEDDGETEAAPEQTEEG